MTLEVSSLLAEHEVLEVSYCDWSMSVVHLQFALKAYSSYTHGLVDLKLGRRHRNLVGGIGVTCRSKIVKSFGSEIQDGS